MDMIVPFNLGDLHVFAIQHQAQIPHVGTKSGAGAALE